MGETLGDASLAPKLTGAGSERAWGGLGVSATLQPGFWRRSQGPFHACRRGEFLGPSKHFS